MKKTALISFTLLFATTFAQTKRAALVYLNTTKPQVTFYGLIPQRGPDAPSVYFKNGETFNDTIIFNELKNKVKEVLPKLNFAVIPEDSVITTSNYKEIIKATYVSRPPNEVSAKGYAHSDYSLFGVNNAKQYFQASPIPDIIMEASAFYELNNAGTSPNVKTNLVCDVTIKGFSPKGKKVFKLHVKYTNPTKVLLNPSNTSGWGFDINGNISKLQKETLDEALKLIDAEIPEQLEKVNKFYK